MWMYVRKNPIEVQTLPYLGNDVDQHGKVKKEVAVSEKEAWGKYVTRVIRRSTRVTFIYMYCCLFSLKLVQRQQDIWNIKSFQRRFLNDWILYWKTMIHEFTECLEKKLKCPAEARHLWWLGHYLEDA